MRQHGDGVKIVNRENNRKSMMSLAVLHNNIGALLQRKGSNEEATKHYHDSIAAAKEESTEDPAHRAGLSWFHRKLQAEGQSHDAASHSKRPTSRRGSSLARSNSGLNANTLTSRRRSSIVQAIDDSPELSSDESTPLGFEYYGEPLLLVSPDALDMDAAAAALLNLALLSYSQDGKMIDLEQVLHLLKKAKPNDSFLASVRDCNLGVVLFRIFQTTPALQHLETANQKTKDLLEIDDTIRIQEDAPSTHQAQVQEQLYLRMAVLLNHARVCVRINDVKKAAMLCDEIADLVAIHKQRRSAHQHRSHSQLGGCGAEDRRSISFSQASPSKPRSIRSMSFSQASPSKLKSTLQFSPANPRPIFQMSPATKRPMLHFTPDNPRPILQFTPDSSRSLSQLSPMTQQSLLVPSPFRPKSLSQLPPERHKSLSHLPLISDRRHQSFSQLSNHNTEHHRSSSLLSQKLQHRIYWISTVASMYLMAMVYQRQEDLKQALDLYRQFLAKARHQLGHSHLHVATVLYMKGMALFDQRKLHHAMLAQLASMRIHELHVPGGNPTELARVMYSIGRTLHDREDYRDALSMYMRTLQLQTRNKPDTFEAVTTMCNIARVHHICGELEPCLDMNQKIVQLTRRLTGGNRHPFLADRLVVLGNVLLETGRTSDAMDAFSSAARAGGGEHLRSSSYDVDTRSAKFLGRVGLQHPGAASA